MFSRERTSSCGISAALFMVACVLSLDIFNLDTYLADHGGTVGSKKMQETDENECGRKEKRARVVNNALCRWLQGFEACAPVINHPSWS